MFLRQSTASQVRSIGPFVASSDFLTLQTALTIANTDVKLIPNGGTQVNKNSGGGTHRGNGMYSLTFDATDTATVGELSFTVSVAGALVVFGKFFVLEEAVYDALFAASAPGYVSNHPVSVAQWAGTNVATPDTAGYPKVTLKSGTGSGELSLSSGTASATFSSPYTGTAQAGSTTTITLASGTTANQASSGDVIVLTGGATSAGPSGVIASVSGAGGSIPIATLVQPWNGTPPASGSTYRIDKVGGIVPADSSTLGSAAGQANILARLPGSLIGGRIDANFGSAGADVITAATLASDATTEITAGLLAAVVEGTTTLQQAMRLLVAVVGGNSTGHPAAPIYRDLANSKNRVTAVTDENGNRTVTRDLT